MYVTLSKISDNYTHATREKQFLMNIVVKKKFQQMSSKAL